MALNLPDSRTNSRLAAKKLQRSSPEPHPSVSSSPSRGKGMENLSFFSGGIYNDYQTEAEGRGSSTYSYM